MNQQWKSTIKDISLLVISAAKATTTFSEHKIFGAARSLWDSNRRAKNLIISGIPSNSPGLSNIFSKLFGDTTSNGFRFDKHFIYYVCFIYYIKKVLYEIIGISICV